MDIIVLGAGTFGTAIANELSVNTSNKVLLYSRNAKKVDEVNTLHTNSSCFPNKHLTKYLQATSDINDIVHASIILIALPSKVIIENLRMIAPSLKDNVLLINLSKGLLSEGITIVESIYKELGINNVATLKGPSFAVEIMEHADTLLTFGSPKIEHYDIMSSIIKGTALHIDYTTDIRGVELLSVLKNVYALVIGVVDAKYNSANTRFMILTKAFTEIRILLKSLGGADATLFLACGFGDFCLTSLNDLSRNRTLGLLIGKGFFSADYKSNTVILEGLNSIDMLYDLIIDNDIIDKLPLFNKLYSFFENEQEELKIMFNDLN